MIEITHDNWSVKLSYVANKKLNRSSCSQEFFHVWTTKAFSYQYSSWPDVTVVLFCCRVLSTMASPHLAGGLSYALLKALKSFRHDCRMRNILSGNRRVFSVAALLPSLSFSLDSTSPNFSGCHRTNLNNEFGINRCEDKTICETAGTLTS